MSETSSGNIRPDASELIVNHDERYVCETYIFEPNSSETSLGRLFAVGEVENRGGVGRELLDLTIQALQREYYRDPSRGVLASFESALHQANLVLHDSVEQGVKDWMGYFHVAVGVLTGTTLHISTAGNSEVLLIRRQQATVISQDLAHSPITNPLRTFAQVASGTLTPRDTLFLASSAFSDIFRQEDVIRFAIDHSASTISTRLEQLYADQGVSAPLCVLTISILPEHFAQASTPVTASSFLPSARRSRTLPSTLQPRQPLVISRSWLRASLVLLSKALMNGWTALKTNIWPAVLKGSQHSGRAIVHASRKTGQQLSKWKRPQFSTDTTSPVLPTAPLPMGPAKKWPVRLKDTFMTTIRSLPRSSQIFAGITVILVVALIASVLLLRHKRADDASIQRASELLHDAQTKKQAAETALIYDNRDQARSLLAEASAATEQVQTTGLYAPEVSQLQKDITAVSDRLQRIQRVTPDTAKVVGDFKTILSDKTPTSLSFVNNNLYTFNPTTNAIVSMTPEGEVSLVSDTNQGIGFFVTAAEQAADKTIIFITADPGLALFDAKTSTVQAQTIQFPNEKPNITSAATFGNRLYLYDQVTHNIYSYTKTLRGYSSGTPWITNADFPKDSIKSIGIDSNIYTLHSDGTIRKLLKGEPAEFKAETIDPPLTSATKLIKNEQTANIYVLDKANKRVVVFDTKGRLQRQIYIDNTSEIADMAISSDEKTLYILDGTQVLSIPLGQ